MISLRRRRFVRNLLSNGFDQTRAVIDAGYSEKGAHVQASRLLKNATINELINKSIDSVIKGGLPLIKKKLHDEYINIAFSDMTDYIDETGKVTDAIKKKSKTSAIQSMEFHDEKNGGGLKKLTLHPKLPAMEKLANLVNLGNPEKGGEADELARRILGEFKDV